MTTAMPKPLPPYVQVHRRRSGEVVYYFRKNRGQRHRLPAPGSPDFEKAYTALLVDTAEKSPPKPPKAAQGSLRWLVGQWQHSSDWAQASPATRRQRENILIDVLERIGDDPFAGITAADVREGRERRADRPFAADNFIKTMRALFRWAVEAEHVDENPAEAVKLINAKTTGFEPWTDEDVALYRKRWPVGTRERLALELLMTTGLRRGDAVRLGHQHVRDGVATLRAEKNGKTLYLTILPSLQEAIDAMPRTGLTFLGTKDGRPLAKETFGNYFRHWCEAAGVTKSAHGVRKWLATTMAEHGASELQLQAAMGWNSPAVSKVYTREARDRVLAAEAAQRLNRARPHAKPVTPTRIDSKGEK